jgi:hypothetical protein
MRASPYEAAPFHRGARSSSQGAAPVLRLGVYVTHSWLDRRIAAGADCAATAALELRARQLTAPRTRRRLARELRELVEYAARVGSRPTFSAVVVYRRGVLRGRHALLGLAERLEGETPVSPRGVTHVRRLLTDGLGPLFNPNSEQTVIQAVWNIEDALDAGQSGR